MRAATWIIVLGTWISRLLALGLFLLWGAFFVEHLQEWFLHPAHGYPPLRVWLAQTAHLLMLVGLIALLRWELAGAVLTILGALAFFGPLAIKAKDVNRALPLLLYLAVTIVPAILTLACRTARQSSIFPPTIPSSKP